MKRKARVLAMYLPQYHPIPENDAAWGKGFTEWTNVVQARPHFWGHYQPKIPADLGFYDLRLSEVREAQAEMAREAGIEGFMYWHYWFGNGRKLLQRPFEEVLTSGKPDYPFCLGWANHSWMTKTWKKGYAFQKNPMIMEQLYPGKEDYILHFNYCLPAFKDPRYIRVDGKPIFVVFSPRDMPDVKQFTSAWQQLAKENGLQGIHFVGIRTSDNTVDEVLNMGFDAVNNRDMKQAQYSIEKFMLWSRVRIKMRQMNIPSRYDYRKIVDYMLSSDDLRTEVYPTILAGYDRTARAGGNTVVYVNYNPETFEEHAEKVIEKVSNKDFEHRIVFLKSWNEWGEGNYVEPDLKYGHAFLDALKNVIVDK
jgi:hypothetical protein